MTIFTFLSINIKNQHSRPLLKNQEQINLSFVINPRWHHFIFIRVKFVIIYLVNHLYDLSHLTDIFPHRVINLSRNFQVKLCGSWTLIINECDGMIGLVEIKNIECSWRVGVGCELSYYKNSESSFTTHRF